MSIKNESDNCEKWLKELDHLGWTPEETESRFNDWLKNGKPKTLKPSKEAENLWISVNNQSLDFHDNLESKNIGKWLIFVPLNKLDATWKIISQATIDGKLGISAKSSTAKPNPNATNKDKVICVYTYNYQDKEDVMRVREELRQLGIVNKITYKTDQATEQGEYGNRGDKDISLYFL